MKTSTTRVSQNSSQKDSQKQGSEQQKDAQQKYLQLQLLSSQLRQVQEQVELIQLKVLELEELNRNLDVLRGVGKKKEILAPLGENTFVRAELKDSEKVLVHAGAKVMVDRNIAEAKEMNRKQMDELNAFLEQMKADLLRMFSEQERLTSELEGSLHQ